MEVAKKRRTVARSTFTRTLNILKAEINAPVTDPIIEGAIADRFSKLEMSYQEIKELDEKIIDYMIEAEATDEELIAESKDTEANYLDEFITMKRLVSKLLSNTQAASARTGSMNQVGGVGGETQSFGGEAQNFSPSSNIVNKQYRLPKLSIPVYDGTLINYLSFWSQFKKIHTDESLEDSDKFQYLLQSVKAGTRAKDLLESYPLTSENYKVAVTAFQERFGKKELLIEVYVRELLKLIITNVRANGKDRLPLPDLFVKVDAYLRSLESMGLKAEANSAWLYPMVESSLPQDILRAWQRSPLANLQNTNDITEGSEENENSSSLLTRLMEFLRREVEGEERLKLARQGFDTTSVKDTGREKWKKPNVSTAAGLFSGKENCIFCSKGNHSSKDCLFARKLPMSEKLAKIQEKRCCLKCLKYGHFAKSCKSFIKCHVCSKPHIELMCPKLSEQDEKLASEVVQSTIANTKRSSEVALMTLNVNIKGKKVKEVRVLLDCGSQRSYVLKSTAKELGLKPYATEHLAHALFGGSHTEAKPHNKYVVKLFNNFLSSEFEFEFLDQDVICGEVPRVPKDLLLKELRQNKIWVSDLGPGCPKIEILIGSDIYGKILTGKVKQLQNGLTAIQTKLGWALCGQVQDHSKSNFPEVTNILATNLSIQEMKIPELWKLETIGILDPVETLTKRDEEELAHDSFIQGLSRNEDGRYSVRLPWTSGYPSLSSNRHEAEKRLFSTTRRLKSMNKLEEYKKIFQEWQKEDVIEEVPVEDLENFRCHYLPHHPVLKPDSLTTKIRPVFDASCKRGRTPSLNECLLKGPNLIENIPAILLRFREKAIGVVSDIRRAFLQIEIKKEDRDYLRFLWWDKPDKIKEYRHKRVVFGVTCSPFLLEAVIRHHLLSVSEEFKAIADKLKNSFYVDNCVSSVDNTEELVNFVIKATKIFADAKMDLRLWEFGPFSEIELMQDRALFLGNSKDIVSVLGLLWDRADDTLKIGSAVELKTDFPSKREILSITQGIYDPIGFLAPVLLPAKLLVQEAWATKLSWDIPLPDNIQKAFVKWYSALEVLNGLRIPRRIGFGDRKYWTVHVFCDASLKAYATVIFLRCEESNDVSVQLLAAKSRLSPLKKTTVPRLELLACVLGARLCHFVYESLDIPDVPVYFWTDSSTALAWIRRNDQWGTFVGNRVKEICKLTNPLHWFFVPGLANPADLPSRGCTARELLESRWWEGPDWLKGPKNCWIREEIPPEEDTVLSEKRKTTKAANVNIVSDNTVWYCKFNQYSKIVRILGWMRRFIQNASKREVTKDNMLSVAEIESAKKFLWRTVQQNSFQKIGDSCKGLIVIKDDEGLIRVKTKIIESGDEFNFRYPILLPSKNHLVTCLIRELHTRNCHAGLNILSAKLRENFFVISARRAIRSVITKCAICKRFNAKACNTPPIHLPVDRVRDAATFEVVGIDLCGPLYLKNRSKVWIVLFTCAVYRAVHLELVASLSTDTFIQALRRFIARRGRPSTIYTDNGSNFGGTDSALKRLNWKSIELSVAGVKPLIWKFNPPTAAWWGGWWERLIRSVKSLLLRVLGNSSVNYEELLTILCDVEAQINSRPLTYISDSSCDLVPLTPSMFLQDIPKIGVPDLDTIDRGKLQLRVKHCQKLREDLRTRFRKEYLGQLVQRAGEKGHSLKVGDVVIVAQENVKRQFWNMARVEKIFPSRDGCPRVAQVKTKSGTLVRPLKRLYPLEISAEDPIIRVVPERVSRYGRKIKAVNRLSFPTSAAK